MNFFLVFSTITLLLISTVMTTVEHGEISYHRIEKRQFNFGQWGRNMGQRGENYGRAWGRQW